MPLHNQTLDRLIREAEEARLQEALLVADGEELLDRARIISEAAEQRVAELTERRTADLSWPQVPWIPFATAL
jgi:hypothetical protein